jgi:hypothetical protein
LGLTSGIWRPVLDLPTAIGRRVYQRVTRGERRRDCLAIVVAAAAFVAVVRPFQNTPFVDDWVYAWSVEHLLQTGRLQVLDISSNLGMVQTLWGALFATWLGFSFTTLGASTWVLATIGLCALYLLLRELDVPARNALIGTATLGVYPVFAILSVTFMTDVPFVSLTTCASWVFVRAERTHSTRLLLVASLLASLAMGTRMIAVVTPVAMCLALAAGRDPWGRRRGRWAMTLLPLLTFVFLGYWYQSHVFHVADVTWVPNSPPHRLYMLQFALPLLPQMLPDVLMLAIGGLGLGLLPLSAACVRPELLRRATVAAILLAGTVFAGRTLTGHYILPLDTGQTWALNELGGNAALTPGYHGPYVSAIAGGVAMAVAVASLAPLLAGLGLARRSTADLFLVLAALGHVASLALLWLIHDHYLLVLFPYAIALILRSAPPLSVSRAVAALAIMAGVSTAGVLGEQRYTRAVWQAVQVLRQAGAKDVEIDGGYTVNGWLQWAHPDRARRDADGNVVVIGINATGESRYTVSHTRPAGSRELARFSVNSWIGPAHDVYAVEKPDPPK